MSLPRAAAVVVAAGSGTRVGLETNKVLLPLLGEPVLAWSLRTLCAVPTLRHVVVVVRREDADEVEELTRRELRAGQQATLVEGGPTRHGSEWRGLQPLAAPVADGEVEVVAVHDAARPLATPDLVAAVLRSAARHGGAVPVRPMPGLVDGQGARERRDLAGMQTPQAFRAAPLLEAYRRAQADGFAGTDTAACVARYSDLEVHGVPAPATNLKVTFLEDLPLAERLLLAGRG